MTNTIEQDFFKTFGVEPICDGLDCSFCTAKCNNGKYPEITDRVLLQLICALADTFVGEYCIPDVDYNNLKWHILKDCIDNDEKGQLKDLVQSLFREGKNEKRRRNKRKT